MKTLRHALLSLLLLLPLLLPAQTRRALVIGIGEQQDKSWGKINGDRDVPLVKGMLAEAGFRDVRTLINRQATKAAIVKAFARLAHDCQRGDRVYVHFSGHGQQMTDREGDEADRWDEAWIPYDACRKYGAQDRGEKHLTDDEVERMLAQIWQKIGPAGKLLVVIDACHSGSGTRGDDGTGAPVRGAWDRFVIPSAGKPQTKVPAARQPWVTLSACKDYQSNFEMEKKGVGKLTYALRGLMAGKRKLTNQEVEARLKTFMRANPGRSPQTPVMSGATETTAIADLLQTRKP